MWILYTQKNLKFFNLKEGAQNLKNLQRRRKIEEIENPTRLSQIIRKPEK